MKLPYLSFASLNEAQDDKGATHVAMCLTQQSFDAKLAIPVPLNCHFAKLVKR